VLKVSSPSWNNEWQSFVIPSYSAIVKVGLDRSPPNRFSLQDFFQLLNVSHTTTVNKLLECSTDRPRVWVKSGLFDGQFSGSTKSGTWRRNCLSWTMSWRTILLKDKVITRQLPNVRQQTLIQNDVTVIRTVNFCPRLNKHQWLAWNCDGHHGTSRLLSALPVSSIRLIKSLKILRFHYSEWNSFIILSAPRLFSTPKSRINVL